MVDYRPLTPDDVPAADALWEIAFGPADPPGRRREQARAHLERLEGAFVKGRLAAVLRLYPFRMTLAGTLVPMGGVASVATAPQHRGRGLARKLVKRALARMREEGVGWSGLWAFSEPYYRNLGWARCHQDHRLELAPRDLPRHEGLVEPGQPCPAPDLEEVYRDWSRRYNLCLERTAEWWARRLGVPGLLYRAREEGETAAYLFLRVDHRKRRVRLLDFAWRRASGARALLGTLRSFASQSDLVVWKAPASQGVVVPDLLGPGPSPRIERGMMLRVVDVGRALGSLPAPRGAGCLRLEVADEVMKGNPGIWEVEWGGGRLEIRRSREAARLRLDVRALAQLVSGYLHPRVAVTDGLVEGEPEEAERLASLGGGRPPHCADFF